jgi:hypothetical protein
MFRKRSAVKPGECENVAKKLKKKTRSSTRDFKREVESPHYATVKQGPYSGT